MHDDISPNLKSPFIESVWLKNPLPYDMRIDHRTCNKCKSIYPQTPIVDYEEWCPKCNVKWKGHKRSKEESERYASVVRRRAEIYCDKSDIRFDCTDPRQVTLAVNRILLGHHSKLFRLRRLVRWLKGWAR